LRLALDVLAVLQAARQSRDRGLGAGQMARQLQRGDQDLTQALEVLQSLDWVASLHEDRADDPRWVLLVEPAQTSASPLIERLLLASRPPQDRLWATTRWHDTMLSDILPGLPGERS
jgi:membrane protein